MELSRLINIDERDRYHKEKNVRFITWLPPLLSFLPVDS